MLLGIALQKDLLLLNFSFFLYIFLTKKINPQHSTSILWRFEPTCSTLLHDLLHSAPLLLHPLCSWRKAPGCKNLLSDAPCMQSLTRKWIPWIRSLYFFQGFGVSKLFPCTVFDKEIGENKTLTWNLLPIFFLASFCLIPVSPLSKNRFNPIT